MQGRAAAAVGLVALTLVPFAWPAVTLNIPAFSLFITPATLHPLQPVLAGTRPS